ncbi:MAG: MFS transporter [Aigarchaeota archaeon]|nr:MFS transporter [Aigarchaeota archaeon]MDW8092571.1 MFS transporter [Nitrososphaerota archaeon]
MSEKAGRLRQLSMLSIAHYVNDIYSTVAPPLYPRLIQIYGLSYAMTGMMTAAYQLCSALLQPLFGYLHDKRRPAIFMSLALILGGVGLGLIGYVNNFLMVLILIALSGLGSAIFHPPATAYSSYEATKYRGTLFSVFMTAGRLGAASGPLIAITTVTFMGLQGLIITLLIPALVLIVPLYRMSVNAALEQARFLNGAQATLQTGPIPVLRVSGVIFAGILLHFIGLGLISFLSPFAVATGMNLEFGALLLTVMMMGQVIGVPILVSLSDILPRGIYAAVLMFSTALLVPSISGIIVELLPVVIFVIGAFLASVHAILILVTHEMMPNRKGLATSLIYGISLGGGGLLSPLLGRVIDLYGFSTSFVMLAVIGLIGGGILLGATWGLRGRSKKP